MELTQECRPVVTAAAGVVAPENLRRFFARAGQLRREELEEVLGEALKRDAVCFSLASKQPVAQCEE